MPVAQIFISLLNTVDTWVDRTKREVSQWDEMTLDEKNQRGIEILSGVPVADPTTPTTTTPAAPATQHRPRK